MIGFWTIEKPNMGFNNQHTLGIIENELKLVLKNLVEQNSSKRLENNEFFIGKLEDEFELDYFGSEKRLILKELERDELEFYRFMYPLGVRHLPF